MPISNLCGYLPSKSCKKTLRQRLLEFIGRITYGLGFVKIDITQMAQGIKNLHKSLIGFWGRFYTSIGVVLMASVYNISPYGIFKLISAIGFLLFTEASFVANYPSIYMGIKVWIRTLYHLSRKQNVEWIELPPRMKEISAQMGVKMNKIGIMNGLDNAVSLPFFKRIIIGRPLWESMSEESLCSVFAHEITHVKEKHNLIPLFAIPVIFSQLVVWSSLPIQLWVIGGLAFSRIAFIPFNWIAELRADDVAGRVTSRAGMIGALRELDFNGTRGPSETHPSIRGRIRRLEKGPISGLVYWILVIGVLFAALLPILLARV